MYELLYMSLSPEGLSEPELKDLLECSRIKNHNIGVTGMLVYCGREFMQILEGEKDIVKNLFQTISEDSRHRSVEIFYEGAIENRAFTDWSMAFKVIDETAFGRLVMGHEDFDPLTSPMYIVKESPNRGKKAFLSLRETL